MGVTHKASKQENKKQNATEHTRQTRSTKQNSPRELGPEHLVLKKQSSAQILLLAMSLSCCWMSVGSLLLSGAAQTRIGALSAKGQTQVPHKQKHQTQRHLADMGVKQRGSMPKKRKQNDMEHVLRTRSNKQNRMHQMGQANLLPSFEQ